MNSRFWENFSRWYDRVDAEGRQKAARQAANVYEMRMLASAGIARPGATQPKPQAPWWSPGYTFIFDPSNPFAPPVQAPAADDAPVTERTAAPRCECGVDATGTGGLHSDWCLKHVP